MLPVQVPLLELTAKVLTSIISENVMLTGLSTNTGSLLFCGVTLLIVAGVESITVILSTNSVVSLVSVAVNV